MKRYGDPQLIPIHLQLRPSRRQPVVADHEDEGEEEEDDHMDTSEPEEEESSASEDEWQVRWISGRGRSLVVTVELKLFFFVGVVRAHPAL